MNKSLLVTIFALLLGTGGSLAIAQGEELCLDCHEPAEDWEEMSVEEILETAADTSIKRHADNGELSEEELRAIVDTLMAE